MIYEELHRRFGAHVSERLRRDLTNAEFKMVDINDLTPWLEKRAEAAHAFYHKMLSNPLAVSEQDQTKAGEACRRWRDAEDLSYLVAIAEDVETHVLKKTAAK